MRTTRSAIRNQAFTLIEAMMASVILSFCVIALASAMTAATQQAVATNAKAAALHASSAGTELLAAHPLSDLYLPAGGTTQSLSSSVFATNEGLSTSGSVKFVSRSVKQGTRDLAVVSVTSTSNQGPSVTLYRLISKEGNGQ